MGNCQNSESVKVVQSTRKCSTNQVKPTVESQCSNKVVLMEQMHFQVEEKEIQEQPIEI